MNLRPRVSRALVICLALLGLAAVSVLSAAIAAHVKRAPLATPEPPVIQAALVPKVTKRAVRSETPPPPSEPRAIVTTVTVAKGDRLMTLLVAAGGERRDADAAIAALSKRFDPRKLRIGQRLTVVLDPGANLGGAPRLAAFSLSLDDGAYLVVRRRGDGFMAMRTSAPFAPGVDGSDWREPLRTTLHVRRGDTLVKLLARAGTDQRESHAAIAALSKLFDPHRLRVGQKLVVVFDPGDDTAAPGLAAISLAVDDETYVVVGRTDGGGYAAKKSSEPLIPSSPTKRTAPATPAAEAADRETTRVTTGSPAAATPADEARVSAAAAPADSASGAEPASVEGEYRTLRIRKGDTLMDVLQRAGCTHRDAVAAAKALSRLFDPRRLQIDQELTVVFDRALNGAARPKLAAVSLALKNNSYVVAGRDEDGLFTSKAARAPLLAALFPSTPSEPEVAFLPEPENALRRRLRVERGDTLMDALLRAGSERREAHAAIGALRRIYNPRRLMAGQRLTVTFEPGEDEATSPILHSVALDTEPGHAFKVGRIATGEFAARAVDVPLKRILVHAGGRIDSSLYKAALDARVPHPLMMELINAFSYDVDFQRDIQRGDDFAVLFERYLDDTGEAVREGDLLYARLTLSGTPLEVFRYVLPDGIRDYFDENGQSIRKALLRTPVNGARLTSGYGKRRHPILGYTRMHRGLDFAAPRGTPIVAAGDGVIERAGWYGAYGRYVRVRHRGVYSTAYAHLTRLAKGIHRGSRVKQGQIIGYVGSTGRTTGPHLHYEVLKNGRQINPLKIKLPSGPQLKDADLARFEATRRTIKLQLAVLPLVHNVAENQRTSGCGVSRSATEALVPDHPGRC